MKFIDWEVLLHVAWEAATHHGRFQLPTCTRLQREGPRLLVSFSVSVQSLALRVRYWLFGCTTSSVPEEPWRYVCRTRRAAQFGCDKKVLVEHSKSQRPTHLIVRSPFRAKHLVVVRYDSQGQMPPTPERDVPPPPIDNCLN